MCTCTFAFCLFCNIGHAAFSVLCSCTQLVFCGCCVCVVCVLVVTNEDMHVVVESRSLGFLYTELPTSIPYIYSTEKGIW